MQLTKLHYKNYRLLSDTVLNVDNSTTLIVGRNNTGKTSCMDFLCKILQGKAILFDDYPLSLRTELCNLTHQFLCKKLSFEELSKKIACPSLIFEVDYSLEKDDDLLGALSPFIIDVNEDTTMAIISVEYKFRADESLMLTLFENCTVNDAQGNKNIDIKLVREKIIENFSKVFVLTIFAVNPKNENDTQLKELSELKELFPFYTIFAERYLDESGDNNKSTLKDIISAYFNYDVEENDASVKAKINELRQKVESANKDVRAISEKLLSTLVHDAIGFGYPNTEELQLGVQTTINISNQIKNTAELTYKELNSVEELPSTYNGLGYKNLIKIQFELAAFTTKIKQENSVCIPLLFIEEPESHMHPQLQQTFANYIEAFIRKLSDAHIQVIITSHSGHIANTMDFSKIRYAQKSQKGIIFKDLNTFSTEHSENIAFIKKYLTLSRCDLFFADKAIFVEGASERILLPDIINKCDKEKLFDSQKYKLPSQYYSVIEVGGAYAYRFIPFVKFLGIPCLILTDIDPAIDGRTKAHISDGKTTFNATIKWWIRQVKNINEKVIIDLNKDIIKLPDENKTIGKCHIEYQIAENGLCGRSLEESIKNVNRDFYGIGNNPSEEDLDFSEKSKTEFALKLVDEKPDYNIPQYIKDGLKWLNNQKVII